MCSIPEHVLYCYVGLYWELGSKAMLEVHYWIHLVLTLSQIAYLNIPARGVDYTYMYVHHLHAHLLLQCLTLP